jgi:lipid-A-disaccharide synthase
MIIAGEASGDLLSAELMKALAVQPEAAGAIFFGAGGPKMAEVGVELAFDMTQHAVVGLWEVLKNYAKFRRLFNRLLKLAFERRPDVIICVDFSGFNRRFARAVCERRRALGGAWQPKIVQYVSPQVWASRPGRAKAMARDFDLLLTIFPFEKPWYAERVPELKVEFVGHPMVERHQTKSSTLKAPTASQSILLLPGSRVGELKRHLPVMLGALKQIQSAKSEVRARMVLPNESLVQLARAGSPPANLEIQVGNLAGALAQTTVALASTGTVTMECACFGVPTVTLYKTSWLTFQVARRLVTVTSLTMPNLLAGEPVFPEFIQHEANAANIARAVLDLLNDTVRRDAIRVKLDKIVLSLGGPGASRRAAKAILNLLQE